MVPFFNIVAQNETLEGFEMAVKVLNKHKIRKHGLHDKVKQEINSMKSLNHPNIIRLFQVIDTPSDIFLVMELATGGDIFERILKHGLMKENQAKRLFFQLVSTMKYVHEQGISHRDLKLENLLLD